MLHASAGQALLHQSGSQSFVGAFDVAHPFTKPLGVLLRVGTDFEGVDDFLGGHAQLAQLGFTGVAGVVVPGCAGDRCAALQLHHQRPAGGSDLGVGIAAGCSAGLGASIEIGLRYLQYLRRQR